MATKFRKSKPIFSIITICLNDMEGLTRTRASIKEQTNLDFEWVVIDGASKDGTKAFLEKLSTSECHWISEPDNGLYDAMNKGIERAAGEYLIFLNSGDEFASSGVLEAVAKRIFQGNTPSFIYGDSLERASATSLVYKPARNHSYLWYGMFTHHQAMFYNRKAVGSLRYSLLYPIGADYAFTAELILKSVDVNYLQIPVCIFERGGLSEKNIRQGENDQFLIRRKVLRYPVVVCYLIRSMHAAIKTIKAIFPSLHHFVRYSKKQFK